MGYKFYDCCLLKRVSKDFYFNNICHNYLHSNILAVHYKSIDYWQNIFSFSNSIFINQNIFRRNRKENSNILKKTWNFIKNIFLKKKKLKSNTKIKLKKNRSGIYFVKL
jgi:hypothetical protein